MWRTCGHFHQIKRRHTCGPTQACCPRDSPHLLPSPTLILRRSALKGVSVIPMCFTWWDVGISFLHNLYFPVAAFSVSNMVQIYFHLLVKWMTYTIWTVSSKVYSGPVVYVFFIYTIHHLCNTPSVAHSIFTHKNYSVYTATQATVNIENTQSVTAVMACWLRH